MFSHTPHGLGFSGVFVDCCSGPSSNKKKLMTSIVPWCSLQESIKKFLILFTALSLYLTFEWRCFFYCFLVVFSSQSSGLQSVVFISLLFLRLVAFSPLGDHILTAVTNIATKTVLDFFPQLGVIISSLNQLWPFLTLYCSFKSTD